MPIVMTDATGLASLRLCASSTSRSPRCGSSSSQTLAHLRSSCLRLRGITPSLRPLSSTRSSRTSEPVSRYVLPASPLNRVSPQELTFFVDPEIKDEHLQVQPASDCDDQVPRRAALLPPSQLTRHLRRPLVAHHVRTLLVAPSPGSNAGLGLTNFALPSPFSRADPGPRPVLPR